ncbi:MAG TPA: 1-phosphofructokinase family hexose kinase [Streptosporangiaceae bacterium]|jgi:1-phosphofructokinase
MIVSVTPNPSVDRTIAVPGIRRGEVVRATSTWHEPSGKGVNVSLALAAHGRATRAVLPVGGPEGDRLARMLTAAGIDFRPVPIAGEVRSNVSLAEPGGTVTKINERGPEITGDEADGLIKAVLDAADGAGWIAGCGSLPPGAPDDFFAELCAAVRPGRARVAVDTSGVPLRAALAARPDLVKPNVVELADATGAVITTIGQALDASALLLDRGAGQVLTSLGRDGALLVTRTGAVHGEVAIDRPRSSVGAGDALLAGFLAAGADGPDALAAALDWAGAAVSAPGTLLDPARVDGHWTVRVHDRPDPDRPLTDRT